MIDGFWICAAEAWNCGTTDLLLSRVLREELAHQFCDLVTVRFQGEMASVEEMELKETLGKVNSY